MGGLMSGAASRAWLVVAAVGALVVVIVLGLSLIPRLSAGQDVLDGLGPAFSEERVEGSRAGVNQVSRIVDLADPLATQRGGAAKEAPALIGLVAKTSGLSTAQVRGVLRREAPQTEALLRALPLSAVSRELPGLKKFIAQTLKLSPEKTDAALRTNFPRITQVTENLPAVTNGWNTVPGTDGVTRFNDKPVRSVPDVRDYLSGDVIPVLERQGENFRDLQKRNGVGFIPWLLLVVGLVVLGYGIAMALRARPDSGKSAPGAAAWAVVPIVGLVVIVLVLALKLFPRLDGGDELLSDAKRAFTEERVAGDVAGVRIVSRIVDLADPIALSSGGAAAEVPKLVSFVAKEANLSQGQVVAALDANAPRTLALLQAIPLRGIADEVPHLLGVLAGATKLPGDKLLATLKKETPGIAQALVAVGPVTQDWESITGVGEMTRFEGNKPVRAVREMRDYFRDDLVPEVAAQRENFNDLEDKWPPVNVFPPLLIVVGLIVVLYGGAMTMRART